MFILNLFDTFSMSILLFTKLLFLIFTDTKAFKT